MLFGARLGGYAEGEATLAQAVLAALRLDMLCLADRQFFGHALWQTATATGADLLWRRKHNLRLPREAMLADGSYLTTIYPSDKDRRHRAGGVRVRVVEYRLAGIAEAEPLYRLLTTLLDPAQAPAAELAALYHERWEIEGALAELKTQLRGARVVLRSHLVAWIIPFSINGLCCTRDRSFAQIWPIPGINLANSRNFSATTNESHFCEAGRALNSLAYFRVPFSDPCNKVPTRRGATCCASRSCAGASPNAVQLRRNSVHLSSAAGPKALKIRLQGKF